MSYRHHVLEFFFSTQKEQSFIRCCSWVFQSLYILTVLWLFFCAVTLLKVIRRVVLMYLAKYKLKVLEDAVFQVLKLDQVDFTSQ